MYEFAALHNTSAVCIVLVQTSPIRTNEDAISTNIINVNVGRSLGLNGQVTVSYQVCYSFYRFKSSTLSYTPHVGETVLVSSGSLLDFDWWFSFVMA